MKITLEIGPNLSNMLVFWTSVVVTLIIFGVIG